MRYLIIHNRYSKIGGEEFVVSQQVNLLRSAGHEVYLFERSYDEVSKWKLKKLNSFLSSIYNVKSTRSIKEICDTFHPDVAIIHNLFPVISPAILPILKKRGVRILMTLHNYRLICPIGLFFKKGEICEKCGTGTKEMNCFFNNCQGSKFGSLAFAIRSGYARISKKYLGNVDLFLVLSKFQQNKLVKYGIPKEKSVIIPNFYSPIQGFESRQYSTQNYIGFIGRLSVEKGVELLFEIARKAPELEFKVAGDLASEFQISEIPDNVTLCGFLQKDALLKFYKEARVVISTSLCYEGFPISILEAMYYGKSVLVPNSSVFPEITDGGQCGMMYETGSSSDALDKLHKILSSKALEDTIGSNAKIKVNNQYNSHNYLNGIISASYKK